jgi:thiamine pyrophosphokinase
MSSHHIVRDNQEPALVLANLNGIELHTVQELLEWSPTVVVYAEVVETALALGIKLDVIVTPHDKVASLMHDVQHQAPVKLLSLQPGEDAATLLLYFFRAHRHKAVTWVGVHPQQVQAVVNDLDVVTLYDGLRWVYARSGTFTKWLPAGTVLQVWPTAEMHRLNTDAQFSIVREQSFWVGEKIRQAV